MSFALVLLCSAFASASNICIRTFQQTLQRAPRQMQMYQVCYLLPAAAIYFLLADLPLPAAPAPWLLTLCFGLCMAVASIGTAESLQCGPMSLTSIISSCNVLLPILVGCLVYHEALRLIHLLGMILLLTTLVLPSLGSKEECQHIPGRWYLFVLMSFFGNGFGAVILSAYSKLPYPGTNNSFLGISFVIAAILLLAYLLLYKRRNPQVQISLPVRPLLFVLLAVSVGCVFGANILIMHLSGILPASILYPLYNGTSTVLVCLISCAVFHESIDRKKLLTILLGIGAVVLLNL